MSDKAPRTAPAAMAPTHTMPRSISACSLFACLLGLCAQAHAQDPMHSPACDTARQELEAALNDEASPRAARTEKLQAARKKAALACLGPTRGQPQRSGAPQPAQTVPVPSIAPSPHVAVPSPSIAPAREPIAIPRPAAVTTCDPAGCWDAEGRTINQMGPFMVGPNGLCSAQGGAVSCP